jgi:hypothetical protein
MRTTKRSPRVALAVLAALLAALVVSACGSSSSGGSSKTTSSKNASATTTSSSSSKTASTARTAFNTCLKQHGVTVSKNGFGGFGGGRRAPGSGTGTTPSGGAPGGAGGGGFPGGGGGVAGGNSKFAKAFQACRSKLGASGVGGGFGGRPGGAAGRGNFTPHFSATVLESYVSCIRKNGYAAMPNANTTGKGSVFPSTVEANAKFKAANAKCESILRGSFRPPTAAGTGGTTPTSAGGSTVSST